MGKVPWGTNSKLNWLLNVIYPTLPTPMYVDCKHNETDTDIRIFFILLKWNSTILYNSNKGMILKVLVIISHFLDLLDNVYKDPTTLGKWELQCGFTRCYAMSFQKCTSRHHHWYLYHYHVGKYPLDAVFAEYLPNVK